MSDVNIIKGRDYVEENGLFVWTEEYLESRGNFCHNNCKNCPYEDCFCKKEGSKKP